MLTHATRATAIALLIAASAAAQADWTLDADASRLSFISTKNASKAEVHHFREVSGAVTDNGDARVEVPLDSVETAIPIRNERMREFLFETADFPSLTITASVDPALLGTAGAQSGAVPVTVNLHGQEASYEAAVVVARAKDGSLTVATSEPIVVNAADFELGAGIAKLQELAGLDSISTAVPVSARLVFRQD
ncbi:YceI family protein [Pseudohaliea sp.]|uniref:YceI family protein n=1 Tax=Pseudohaliea sp. TaxID=2740289 RepID=UPI0032ED8F61